MALLYYANDRFGSSTAFESIIDRGAAMRSEPVVHSAPWRLRAPGQIQPVDNRPQRPKSTGLLLMFSKSELALHRDIGNVSGLIERDANDVIRYSVGQREIEILDLVISAPM